MVNPTNYLDFWDVIVNEVIGDQFLLIVIGIIAIVYFALKANMPFQVTILLVLLWMLIIVAATFDLLLYVIAVLSISLFFYFIVSRMFNRG